MEQRVLEKLRKQIHENTKDITIENMYIVKLSEKIRDEMLKASGCRNLSLNCCRLSSLANFPELLGLETLQLNDNSLKDSDLETIAKFKKLKYLYIGGNRIKELKSLEILKDLDGLKFLDVYGNPFTEGNKNYLQELFALLPQLKVVDYLDRNKKEVEDLYSDDTDEEDSQEDDDDEFISNDGGEEETGDKDGEISGKIQNDIEESCSENGEVQEMDLVEEDSEEEENRSKNKENINDNINEPKEPSMPEAAPNSKDDNQHLKKDVSESQTLDALENNKDAKKVNTEGSQ